MPVQTEHRFPLDLSVLDAAACDTGRRPPCPPAASTAQCCRPGSTGCKAPTVLPQRAAKG